MENQKLTPEREPGPKTASLDLLIYVAAAFGFYGLEELMRAVNVFPFPGLFDGGVSLVLSFFVVSALMKKRGQSWPDFGLRRPVRWWFVPLWGPIVLIAYVAAQLTVVPLLARVLSAPPLDLSRYEIIHRNLPVYLVATAGAMVSGGFIEEFIYRGFMIDRFQRLFGGGRRGLVLAALVNGVPFGLIHFEWGFGGMLMTAVMGSVLGLMYLATGRNLWPLVAAHATLDFILLTQVFVSGTGQ